MSYFDDEAAKFEKQLRTVLMTLSPTDMCAMAGPHYANLPANQQSALVYTLFRIWRKEAGDTQTFRDETPTERVAKKLARDGTSTF